MGFLLFFIAYILLLPMTFINFIYVKDKEGYFLSTAENIDRFANREFRTTWNKWFIIKDAEKRFGVQGETISLVLGFNQFTNTLTKTGWVMVYILDTIEKNHSLMAAKLPYDKNSSKLIIAKIKRIYKRLYFNIKVLFISLSM